MNRGDEGTSLKTEEGIPVRTLYIKNISINVS